MSVIEPYQLKIDALTFSRMQPIQHVKRFLSDMPSYYYDQHSVESILAVDNPLIYEYWEIPNDGSSLISMSLTRIAAGEIGDEFYMTKGHFHDPDEDGEEIYVVKQGRGYLLLQNRAGEYRAFELFPGFLYYTPKGWAHRTVNCGEEDLIFITLWPNSVGHDYQSIEQSGFPQIVIKGIHGPMVVESRRFQSHKTT